MPRATNIPPAMLRPHESLAIEMDFGGTSLSQRTRQTTRLLTSPTNGTPGRPSWTQTMAQQHVFVAVRPTDRSPTHLGTQRPAHVTTTPRHYIRRTRHEANRGNRSTTQPTATVHRTDQRSDIQRQLTALLGIRTPSITNAPAERTHDSGREQPVTSYTGLIYEALDLYHLTGHACTDLTCRFCAEDLSDLDGLNMFASYMGVIE